MKGRLPLNRLERIAFVLLCIVAGALLVVTALVFGGVIAEDPATTPATTRAEPKGPRRNTTAHMTTRTSPISTAPTVPPPTTTAAKPTPPAVARTALVVTASRGECWLEIRRGSPTGPVRYAATLPIGQSLRLPGSRFWIRFGAASNVDVTIGGKPVDVPSGTVAGRVRRGALSQVRPRR